jgi:hypothetical protein
VIELVLAAAALAPAYTDEGRRVTIHVSKNRVTRVRGTVVNYTCDQFGNVGPVRFDVRVRARIDRRGRFSFVTGNRAERIGIAGYVKRRKAHGRIRMSGTIGTGERCRSATIRYR